MTRAREIGVKLEANDVWHPLTTCQHPKAVTSNGKSSHTHPRAAPHPPFADEPLLEGVAIKEAQKVLPGDNEALERVLLLDSLVGQLLKVLEVFLRHMAEGKGG